METYEKPVAGEKRVFMTGNEVVAWGALAAQAEIMYGYPITPQNEIMHYWTRMAPRFGRNFLQTEDEIAAGFATIGGVLAGKRSFTATAGPGNILMQEPLSMAEMMRLPTVTVVTQRGGPSTATVIYSQQEVTLTCLGGNGEGLRVVYSTANHQELFDYTVKAFNTAWQYRFPTFILGDGYQAKMREPLIIYDPQDKGISFVNPEVYLGKPGVPGRERDPVHLRNTFNMEEELYQELTRSISEYEKVAPDIEDYREMETGDAEILIVAHGVVSRAAWGAVKAFRKQGARVGLFRPITLRPFPATALRRLAAKSARLVVVESSYGQLKRLLLEALYGLTVPVTDYLRPGLGITVDEIYAVVNPLLKKKKATARQEVG